MAFALRLKCTSLLPKQDTRLVLVASGGTYSDLLTRLNTSFGFPIGCIKWQDSDGDLVTLASDNDLEALLACESGTVQVYVAPVDVPVDAAMVHALRAGAMAAPPPGSVGRLGSAERAKLPTSSASDTSSIASSALRSEQKAAVATVPPTLAMPPTPHPRPASGGGESIVQKIAATPAARGSAFKWQRGKKLGSGAYGTVYLGLLDSGELVAVKQLDTEDVSTRELSALEHEISMLQGLHHENIVRYLGTERVGDTLSIFLEYAPGGSLRQLLDAFGHQLDEATIRTYTRQLLLGLEYLHRAGIAHRDIKGGNVLLGGEGVIKLADFGQAKRLSTKTNTGSSSAGGTATGFGEIKGTPLFMAPEVIREQNMTTGWRKADIWSVGCTVIEMATGRPPWGDKFQNALQAMYTIACTEDLPPLPDTMSAMGKDFLSLCLRRDAASRPDVTLLLLHPFVAGLGPAVARGPRSGRKDASVVQRPSTSHDSRQPSALEAMSAPSSRWIATSSRSKRSGMAAPMRVASSASTMSNDAEDRASIASKDSAALATSVDLAAAPTGPASSWPTTEFESRVVLGMDDLPGLRDSPKHEAGSTGHSRARGAPSHAMYASPDFTPFAFTSVEESSMGSVEVSHLASGRESTETGSVVTTGSAADVSPAPAPGLSDSHGFESLPAALDRPQGRQSARRAGQGALADGHTHGRSTVQASSHSSSHGSTRVLGALRVSPPMRRSAVVQAADRALTESSVPGDGMERWTRAATEADVGASVPTHAAIMAAAIIEGSASSQSHLQRPSSLYSRSQLPYSDGPLPSPLDGQAPFTLPQQDTVSTAARHKYTYSHGNAASASSVLSNSSGKLAGGPQSSHSGVSGIPRIRSAAKTPRSQGQGTPSGSHQSAWQQSQPASAAHRYVTREESGTMYPAPAAAQPPAAIAYTVISDVSGPANASKQASVGATVSTASRIPSAGMRGGGVPSQSVGQGLQGGKSSGLSRTTPMGWAESKERSPEGKPAQASTGAGARSSAMHTRWGGASSDNEMDSAASVATAGSLDAQEPAAGALRVESGSPYRSMARMVSSEVLSTGGAGTYGQAAIHVDRDSVSGRQAGIPAPMPVHPWSAVAGYVQRQNDDSQAANSLSISPNRAAIQSSLTLLRTRSGGFRRPRGSATGATVAALPSTEEHSPDLLPRGEPAGTIMDSSVLGGSAEPTGYAAQFAQRRALQSRSASHGGGAVSPVAKVHPASAAHATGSGDSNKAELQQYADAQAYSSAAGRTTQSTSRHYRPSAVASMGPSSTDMEPPPHGMYEGSAGQGYGSLFSPSHSPLSHVKHANREHRGYG